jgi:magnesium-transporting ATPase (P-type)
MTAVQMAVVVRRDAIDGKGYSAEGQITRVAGQAGIPMDPFLLPLVLASDAVLSDGELIGDRTEGALVALAAKGGVDAASTRDERHTVVSLDTFSDARFVIVTGVSIVTLLLTTVFGPLEAFLKTTPLDARQWLICLAVSLSIVVITEIRKAVRRSSAADSQNHPGKGDDNPEPLAQDLGTGSNRAGPDGGYASLPAA